MKNGSSTWVAPSNIALVKYWGKHGRQLPMNPSISFTLKNSVTTTTLEWQEKSSFSKKIDLKFYFEGKENQKFGDKVEKFLTSITPEYPSLLNYTLVFNSKNSFPHSTGIASSASSMASIALTLLTLVEKHEGKKRGDFFSEASSLSRLGSGSACRSLFGGVVSWGADRLLPSTDECASVLTKIDPIFSDYQDAVIVVEKGTKSVSSREGHAHMESHPFASARFIKARENIRVLLEALKRGDLASFSQIVESEALMLHALMMTSQTPYLLMTPDSLFVIKKINEFKSRTKLPLCFTLDAGPNIHLLYPKNIKSEVDDFIKNEIEKGETFVIFDEVGTGPFEL